MRAAVIHAARDLRIEDRPDPGPPGPGQVRLRVARGGICGSDLHYFNHGGFGPVRLRHPMILGHEVSAHVLSAGAGVELVPGQLVAVSPSRPCGACDLCLAGLPNHCAEMRFYGSAMPFPHVDGAFCDLLLADAAQCVDATGLDPAVAALAEPLAVALHAMSRAGEMIGRRVLVTGCGPIGLLVIVLARAAGAGQIVATDLSDFALAMARRMGADLCLNTARDPQALLPMAAGKGQFDRMFECSGAAAALGAGIGAMWPRGVIVQLGLGGDMTLPMMALTAREIDLRGAFRFHGEFAAGVALMRAGRIDPAPLVTHVAGLEGAAAAFALAGDRGQAIKAQLDFSA